jgi:xylan 1,4-beta-xylosidase
MNRLVSSLLIAPALASALLAANVFENPVRALDLPDPSVIRTRDGYWATATSAEWAPHFPLLFSKDLVNWEPRGAVFPKTPAWAKGNFWAPEIAEDRGTYFVYYTARGHDGRLAVAVATALKPEGPYTDHGSMVAQDLGSIDAVPFTDDEGRRWLLWKEDGNSRKQPTPIFLQALSDDGLKLIGDRRVILTNDAKWEGPVVEAPFVLKHGDFYYMFYSGAGCCGAACDYALGVARAQRMEGPWEKFPANPILAENEAWRCPGHGSIVRDDDGSYWLLYHAYARDGFTATGRQMLLDEVVFGADGWPSINRGAGPSRRAPAPVAAVTQQIDRRTLVDTFDGAPGLKPGWQWPIGREPAATVEDGWLKIGAGPGPAVLAQLIRSPSFTVETRLEVPPAGAAGLAMLGNEANYLALMVESGRARLLRCQNAEEREVAARPLPAGKSVLLRMTTTDGRRFRFAFATAAGAWSEVSGEVGGESLPQWERPVRVGLRATGTARFDYFSIREGHRETSEPNQSR